MQAPVLVGIQFGLSIRDFFFGSGTRLLRRFKVMSAVGSVPSVSFGSRQGCFTSNTHVGVRYKVASVWFGLVQDSFGSVQGCFSLVRFGSRLFQLFKVALAVQGCFVSARSCRWFKVASLRFVSRLFVSVKDFFGSVQGCFYGSRSCRRLVRFLRFHLVQGCFTSNTHVGAVQGRQLLLFRSGALLWCKRDL